MRNGATERTENEMINLFVLSFLLLVNGGWSVWEMWSDCSVTCGGGIQRRTRQCNSPPPDPDGQPCSNISSETKNCSQETCQTCGSIRRGFGNVLYCNYTSDGHQVCQVGCRQGLTFLLNHLPDMFYICGPNTSYQWSNSPPSCAAARGPSAVSSVSTLSYVGISCSNVAEVEQQLREKASNEYPCVRNGTCEFKIQAFGCSSARKRRSQREVKIDIKLTIPLSNDRDLGLETLNSLSNVTCPSGTYAADDTCELCSIGKYQDNVGQTECKVCPSGYTTETVASRDVSDCIDRSLSSVVTIIADIGDIIANTLRFRLIDYIRGSRSKLLHNRVLVNCQYSMATFSTSERKRRPRGDRKSQEMTMHLQQTFNAAIQTNLYPRSQIDIFVEVLQSDGGNYCASVNAATLAVIDAGIPMKDFVCACSASHINDTSVVDINYLEESSGGPEIIVAVLPKSDQIVFLEMNGRLHEDNLSKVIDSAVKGCKDVYTILERTVRDNVSEVASSHGWELQ
ncbi:hypothetical protein FSP39_014771 [Pinctada imbricata]|uniref:Putative exosome complex component RRP41 n=1 Tax=Pinctada imbricata TaxID=66713 RepID=A0AA88XZB5_PINIB|nr:hypothetical protein FSP39_014771 [Pinctada imbricata]